MANQDPVSTSSQLENNLKGVNRELDKAIIKVQKLGGSFSTSITATKPLSSSGLGTAGGLNLGVANANFGAAGTAGGGMMPWLYSAKGSRIVAGTQTALGIAGAGYASLPDTGAVISRATGYYTAAQRGFGTTRSSLARATMQALGKGVTGIGDDVAAANVLTMGYNYAPGGSTYLQAMREVRGAALGYNISNPAAAAAIGGLHTGQMGSTLYQMGISTFNRKTGQARNFEDIARQLYSRAFRGQKGITAQDIEISMREGRIGASMRAAGFDETQMSMLTQAFTNFSQGKGFDLTKETGAGNPAAKLYEGYASQTQLAEKVTDPYIKGLGTATDALVKLNKALEGTPQSILQFKSSMDVLNSSNLGGGINSLIAGFTGAITTLLGSLGLNALMGGKGAGGVVKSLFTKGGAATAAKTIGGKALPALGGAISSQSGTGFMQSVLTSAAVGGVAGSILPGVGTVAGAVGAAGATAVGYGLSEIFKLFKGSKTSASDATTLIQGTKSETQWAGNLLDKLGAPKTDQNLAAITTWMRYEGGGGGKKTGIGKNTAMYNPLNTTQDAPGATSMNKVGVKSYLSWDQGLDATVTTLRNGRYAGILGALYSGASASDVLGQVNASPWGTKIAGYSDISTSRAGTTINITLKIDKASDAEAIAFAKKVKAILEKDNALNTMGSK